MAAMAIPYDYTLIVLLLSLFLFLLGPGCAVAVLFAARRLSRSNWQFSLRTLFITATLIAFALGLAVCAFESIS